MGLTLRQEATENTVKSNRQARVEKKIFLFTAQLAFSDSALVCFSADDSDTEDSGKTIAIVIAVVAGVVIIVILICFTVYLFR